MYWQDVDTHGHSSDAALFQAWLAEINEYAQDDVVIMLLGNKSDMANERVVRREDGERLAKVSVCDKLLGGKSQNVLKFGGKCDGRKVSVPRVYTTLC